MYQAYTKRSKLFINCKNAEDLAIFYFPEVTFSTYLRNP